MIIAVIALCIIYSLHVGLLIAQLIIFDRKTTLATIAECDHVWMYVGNRNCALSPDTYWNESRSQKTYTNSRVDYVEQILCCSKCLEYLYSTDPDTDEKLKRYMGGSVSREEVDRDREELYARAEKELSERQSKATSL